MKILESIFSRKMLNAGKKISNIYVDISPIYQISVMFDMISAIYRRYIGFAPIYRGNIS